MVQWAECVKRPDSTCAIVECGFGDSATLSPPSLLDLGQPTTMSMRREIVIGYGLCFLVQWQSVVVLVVGENDERLLEWKMLLVIFLGTIFAKGPSSPSSSGVEVK